MHRKPSELEKKDKRKKKVISNSHCIRGCALMNGMKLNVISAVQRNEVNEF
jgi:hypothetical protein